MRGSVSSYGPTDWLDYYGTYAILCTGYYTSHHILDIMLGTTILNASCQMHFDTCSQVHSNIHSGLHSIAPFQPAWQYAPYCSLWHTPSLLDLCSEVSPQDAPKYTSKYIRKYTPRHALQDAPNCTRWYTPSLLGSTLPSTLSTGKTLAISPVDILPYILLHARSRDLVGCRRQAPGGIRLMVYGRQCLAGCRWHAGCGMWHAVCGRWQAAYGGQNHDVSQ